MITDEAAVEILQLSKLAEEELADSWEDVSSGIWILSLTNMIQALKATLSSTVTIEPRLGFLNKDEFFVLLSELQAKASISDEDFLKTFLISDAPAPARTNPFKRGPLVEDAAPPNESHEETCQTTKPVDSGVTNRSVEIGQPTKGNAESVDDPPPVSAELENVTTSADGHSESANLVENPVIPPLNPSISFDSTYPLTLSAKSDKNDKEVDRRPLSSKSLDRNCPSLKAVSHMPSNVLPSSTGTRSGEIEVVRHAASDKEVRPLATLYVTSSEQVTDRDHNPHSDETQQQLVLHASSHVVSPNVVEAEAPISTSASDDLALKRLTALRATEPELPPRPEKKVSFSRRLLTKAHLSKSSKIGPVSTDQATVGRRFPLHLLSQALQDAVTEGDIQLVASLFNFGAHVNLSSLEPPKHHHILGVAAVSGQARIIEYFILMGADETSLYHAFNSTFNNGHLEMAMRLVPHVTMYSLKLFVNPATKFKIFISILGQVARNSTVPANNRERMLEVMIDQKQFSATKVVYEIRDKKAPNEVADKNSQRQAPSPCVTDDLIASYNLTQLLISRLDVELVERIITKLGSISPQRAFHDWVITAEKWQSHPRRAMEMLQLLISESAPLDSKTKTQDRMEMTPLAHAVAGGSLEAAMLLLEHNADPECMVYESPQDGKLSTDAYTALGWAAMQGRVDLCRLLVSAGAISWRTGAFSQTPLYWASRHGHLEVVEYLLSLDSKRSSIDDCLIASIEGNEPEIAKLLLEAGASVSPETVSTQYYAPSR